MPSHQGATPQGVPYHGNAPTKLENCLSHDLPVAPDATTFASLGLHDTLLKAVEGTGYTQPTSVQAAAIPAAMAGGDLMVSAATGSGKTAAFLLPALQRLVTSEKRAVPGGGPRILVLTPTRELSMQVTQACELYGRTLKWLRTASVVGGVPYGAQLRAIRGALDVLVATPGRLLDLLKSGRLDLARVEVLVLDEADRMLDMGFIEDIRAIVAATPESRQTLLFSATLDGDIAKLARQLMSEPQRIELATHRDRHEGITQRLHWADNRNHKERLLDHLLRDPSIDQAIVFTSTQRDAERIAALIEASGHAVAALHGGMPQSQRNRTLTGLRHRRLRVLVATDVASRGIDVPTISHVINYGMPMNSEDYVHRIGRTGRAGRTGLAVTLAEHADMHKIRGIERFTTQRIPVSTVEGLEPRLPEPSTQNRSGVAGRRGNGGRSFSGRPHSGRDRDSRSERTTGAPLRARRP